MSKAKKKSRGLFWKIFAVMLLLLCCACAYALYYGYNVMIDYEETQSVPQTIANEYAEKISNGNYDFIEETGAVLTSTDFEENAVSKKLDEIISKAGGCTATKGFSSNRAEKPVYVVMAGDTKIATLEFSQKTEKSKYGFSQYELTAVALNIGGQYEMVALVPEGATLYLNEKKVADTYKTGKTEEIELQAGNLYSGDATTQLYEYYEITGLFNEGVLKIVYGSDTEAVLKYDEERDAWTTKTGTISVKAPSNMTVNVNGICISDSDRFISEEDEAINDIEQALKYIGETYTMRTYTVSGIENMNNVAVTATAFNGEDAFPEVSEDGKEYVFDDCIWPDDIGTYGLTEEWLIERAINYARFVMHDGDRDTMVLNYCYRPAQVYYDFEHFWVTFSPHDKYWVENQNVEVIKFYSNTLFSAKVDFDYWVEGYDHKQGNRKAYHNEITFWYGYLDGKWQIIDFSSNGDLIYTD